MKFRRKLNGKLLNFLISDGDLFIDGVPASRSELVALVHSFAHDKYKTIHRRRKFTKRIGGKTYKFYIAPPNDEIWYLEEGATNQYMPAGDGDFTPTQRAHIMEASYND